MEAVFYILAKVVSIFLSAVSFTMLLRMILSFFVNTDENILYALCCYISEPFILPFRLLCSKFGIGQNSPIDMPFMLAYIGLMLITMFLPVI